MGRPTISQIIKKLNLSPLPEEGGLFRQTYISNIIVSKENLPQCYTGNRSIATHIFYLLTNEDDSFSAIHRLKGDEVYHFYLGDPVELLLLYPNGESEIIYLGLDIMNDENVQKVVSHNIWQGSRLVKGGEYALMGTSMSPGFNPSDFELGDRNELTKKYSNRRKIIKELTRM